MSDYERAMLELEELRQRYDHAEHQLAEIRRLVRDTPTPTGLGLRVEAMFPEDAAARDQAMADHD